MAGTRTPYKNLYKPVFDEEGWDDEINGNFDTIDTELDAHDTALVGKAAAVHTHAQADITSLVTALDGKAPLASPALTGSPTAPTQATSDNSTKIATTAMVQAAVAAKIPAITAGDCQIATFYFPSFSHAVANVNSGMVTNVYPLAFIKVRHAGTYRLIFYAYVSGSYGEAHAVINGSPSYTYQITNITNTGPALKTIDVTLAAGDTLSLAGCISTGSATFTIPNGFAVGIAGGCYY